MNTKNQHNFIVKQMLIFLFESRSWSQIEKSLQRCRLFFALDLVGAETMFPSQPLYNAYSSPLR